MDLLDTRLSACELLNKHGAPRTLRVVAKLDQTEQRELIGALPRRLAASSTGGRVQVAAWQELVRDLENLCTGAFVLVDKVGQCLYIDI